ncbi:MAG TPA: hypothetical protein VFT65_20885 [Candidatus Angelobacter sp.]|nr:hypothetical protein [Candidatus Angelobacter sp.]
MKKYRKLLILAVLLIGAAGAAVLVYRTTVQPPESARLLPDGDLVVYANLKPLHLFDLNKSRPVQLEGDYQDFVTQTGFQFERDLNEVAMSRRDTPNGQDVESSEIFAGHFDEPRVRAYLQKIADKTEQYRNHDVFSVTHNGHMVRVCILDGGRVAVTNMASPEPMHGIIDRSIRPGHGPALLIAHYHDVPVASLGWLIDRIPDKPEDVPLPGGFSLSLPPDTTAVASIRYTGSLLFRADLFAQSQDRAKQIVDAANTHLSLMRSITQLMKARGPDQDVKAVFDSIKAEQKENVAVFTATIPESIIRKLLSEAQAETAAPVAPPQRR